MKLQALVLCLSILLSSPFAAELPDCAVLDLDAAGIDSMTTQMISEKLRAEVFYSGKVRMVERSRMEVILQEQGFQQTGCTTSECRVETGRLLGVSQLVAGMVSHLPGSDTWHITLSLLDVETGAVLQMADYTESDDLNELLQQGIPQVTQRLFGAKESAPISPVEAPNHMPVAPAKSDTTAKLFTPFALAIISPIQVPSAGVPVYGVAVSALYGEHGDVFGLQTGLVARAKVGYGLSASAVSLADERMGGIQVGAFYNSSKEMFGIQAGLVNHADRVIGFQLGLFNSCRRLTGIQVGLWNTITGREIAGSLPILNIGF